MTLIVIALFLGFIPASIASSKGRNGVLWYIYGVLLFIVALFHAILLKPDVAAADAKIVATGDMKACPMCAELVKRAALVCRYCGHSFEAADAHAPDAVPQPPGANQG